MPRYDVPITNSTTIMHCWFFLLAVLFAIDFCEGFSTSPSTAISKISTACARGSLSAHRGYEDSFHADALAVASNARRSFLHGTASILATFSFSSLSYAAGSSSPLPLGAPAPEFSLLNTRGQTITLDALAESGKWTVLYFYPGAFTSGCTLEARRFQEDLSSFQKLNAQIVGVSVDSMEKQTEFCRVEGLDFFMLTDQGGKISKAFGSSLSIPGFGTFSNRQTYIIDPEKNVRWAFTDVESHIPRHSTEVLEKLKELQNA